MSRLTMSIKIKNHTLPLWIIVTMISVLSATVLAAYLTLTISFTVAEPLEIMEYPSTLNLYPGEAMNFSVTVRNHAQVTYAVLLDFSLNDKTYMDKYVKVSNETYFVHPGTQSLAAWLSVSPNATSLNSPLSLSFRREAVEDFATEQMQITHMEFLSSNIVRVTLDNTGIIPVTINEAWINNIKQTGTNPSLPVTINTDQGLTLNISYTITSGFSYQVKLITSKGNVFYYSATSP